MTHKNIRRAAYGMTAIIAASAMGMNVQAVKVSDLMPSAGIGVTFSNGVTLAQIQERVLAEAAQDDNMKLSVSEMKAYLEEKKAAPTTIVSASIVKTVEVQQVLAQIEARQEQEELLAEGEKTEQTAKSEARS